MRNLHQVVINHHRQVINGQPVRLDQNRIVQRAVFNGDIAAHRIRDSDTALARHPKADDVRRTALDLLVCFR